MPSLYANIVSGNATIPSNNNTSLYNPGGGNVVPVNGNVNANNVNVSNNVNVGGQVSAVGDIITDGFFIGNGSQLTGIVSSYGNANVAAFLPTYTGNIAGGNIALAGQAVVSGNITSGGYYFGDGSQLTNLPASSYSNANVADFLPIYSGNISAGNVTVADAITGANIFASGQISSTGDISTAGNLRTLGAQGNIVGANYVSAGYFVGDGSQLTNVVATSTYGNSNVAAYLPTYGGTVLANLINFTNNSGIIEQGADRITITGNATQVNTGAYFNDTGEAAVFANSYVAIATNTTGNVNPTWTFDQVGNLSAPGNISAVGNIEAPYYFGNGSQLTGITAGSTYSNANVASFLADFGSNTISTTGNVDTGNIIVADDRVIYASHGYYGPPDATFAPVRIGLYGPNPAYAIGVENNHSWIQGQSGVKLYDASGVTLVANAAGITGANILTAGAVTATGNVTGNYIFGNGSQLTGLPATYGNSNVVTLLASFGSNTISTSGNVTVGNLTVTGTESDTGNITGGNLLTGGQVTATGNITGNYFIGNGSALTGIISTAGGSNTQIQFNDGTAFAGNAAMTFNKTTGNIVLGNIVTNNLSLNTFASNVDLANANIYGATTPWRITVGNLYYGSANSIYSPTAAGAINATTISPRLLTADTVSVPNTGLRYSQAAQITWANLTANLTNTSTRIQPNRSELIIGGGTGNYTITASTVFAATGGGSAVYLGRGNNANLSLVGNITTSGGAAGFVATATVNNGSNAAAIVGVYSQVTTTDSGGATGYGNATQAIGFYPVNAGALSNAAVVPTSLYASYYHPNTSVVITGTTAMGNGARAAAGYYSFRSDDTLAKAQLGSLSSFNEYSYSNNSTSGSVTISKANGQVQQIPLSGNLTIAGFSNFVTNVVSPATAIGNVYQTDTVTLILNQGATGGYGVTLPTGATYKYAGGINTVGTTANAVTMISVTGFYNTATSATNYLLTVSPEFL